MSTVIEPPIQLVDTGDKQKDLVTNTQKWVAVQERYIRPSFVGLEPQALENGKISAIILFPQQAGLEG